MKKNKTPQDIKTKILLSALPHVAFDGWTEEVLTKAAARHKADISTVFPNGVLDLVLYFSTWASAEMLAALPAPAVLKKMRVRDKITLGVRTHLEILSPYREAVSAALKYLAPIPRSMYLPRQVWQTADVIWQMAGDTATDYNRYTKRILLSGVITSTTIYWLNDSSDDFEKTWVFLDRRISNVLKIGQTLSHFRKKA